MNKQTSLAAMPVTLRRSGHPLEIFPFFRRFRCTPVRDVAYTLILNTLVAAVFTVLALLLDQNRNLAATLGIDLVIANCIGFLIHGGFILGDRLVGDWLPQRPFAVRATYYAALSIIGVFAGYWLAFTLLNLGRARQYVFSAQGAISILLLALIIAAVLASTFFARERQAKAEGDFQREGARVEAAERQLKVSQLELLEAQIEPHFLYNTLANVISLIDADPPTAKRMVERLIDYLRRAALAANAEEATLGGQVGLLRAYLDLIVLRMGARLAYRIDVSRELEPLLLPPMLLQPLVENAIKHGLEPKVAGGVLTVTALRDADRLVLTVSDDGVGVRTTRADGSTGLGLTNLRERLATLYGSRASLAIEDRQPGTTVSVTLPLEHAR